MLIVQQQFGQFLKETLYQNLLFVWDRFKPIVIPMIISGFIWILIRRFVVHCVYKYAIISGNAYRDARKKAKKAGNIVDVVSSIKDINDSLK